jgi:serine/threonine protein kinase
MQATILQEKPLNDRYLIQQVLREEPSECTYIVTDINKPNSKYLLHEYVASDNNQLAAAQNLFNPELQKLQCLQNSQFESILDFFWEKNSLYIVRHRTEGQTYQDILNTHGTVSEEDITRLLRQVLPLLGILHNQNIIHRNICPSSILFNQQNHEITLINPGIFNEIQNYFSPHPTQVSLSQQIKTLPIGILPAGAGEDLYTLGITAAILLTGKTIQELFDLSTLSWDWEQWKLTTDQFSQTLSNFLNANPGTGFSNAAAALQVLNTPVVASVPAPQMYTPAQQSPVYAPQTQYVPPQYAPHPVPGYQAQNFGSSATIAAKSSILQDKRLLAVGGGVVFALLGIIGFLLLNKPAATETTPVANGNQVVSATNSREPVTLTESEAVKILQNWLNSKQQIFAPPFNRELAANLTTGALYYDITKPGGSIDWLRENDAYYQFGNQSVASTGRFSVNGNQATLEAKVTHNKTFYVRRRIDQSQTGIEEKTARYDLRFENGTWKIADYK